MKKIPIKITSITDGEHVIREVMIDLDDYMQLDGDPEREADKFRSRYFELVRKAEKLFFGSNLSKARIKNLASSTCWELGNIFRRFEDDVKNNFVITNYATALEQDFGRSNKYIKELMTFSQLFEKNEVSDSIPMAIYRALVWKKNQLDEAGILDKEKNRLIEMGKNRNHPGREKYKIELINAIKDEKSKIRSKNI